MPQIKIDYVVSFSSEDPEHPASGLASGAADGVGRWLCARGQSSASVLLQMAHAAQICRVTVGAHHAALVEVLAGRSETPHEPFQVLVPSSVFLSAQESRRAEGMERVRSFGGEQLAVDARDRRFDRVRVVVSQPYNKHCQYGLSFIHLFEPEKNAEVAGGPQTETAVDAGGEGCARRTGDVSDDDDEFRPGELFALHRAQQSSRAADNTDTQIRRASALALKNIPDPSTKLTKTPIGKAGSVATEPAGRSRPPPGGARAGSARVAQGERKRHSSGEEPREAASPAATSSTGCASRPGRNKRKHPDDGRGHDERTTEGTAGGHRGKADVSATLRGVVFALSGYVNPRRAALRDVALRLGARYRPDWGPDCTHLVCAFPDTPKLRALRAAEAAGAARPARVVTADWLEQCAARRRRLPWRAFAAEPARRGDAPDSDQSDARQDSDTDDEIERALAARHRRRPSPSVARVSLAALQLASPAGAADAADVAGAADVVDAAGDSDATVEAAEGASARGRGRGALPAPFEGRSFALGALPPRLDAALLRRYVRAYGGLVLEHPLDDEAEADYVLCGAGARSGAGAARGGRVRVRADWVWRCHELRTLAP